MRKIVQFVDLAFALIIIDWSLDLAKYKSLEEEGERVGDFAVADENLISVVRLTDWMAGWLISATRTGGADPARIAESLRGQHPIRLDWWHREIQEHSCCQVIAKRISSVRGRCSGMRCWDPMRCWDAIKWCRHISFQYKVDTAKFALRAWWIRGLWRDPTPKHIPSAVTKYVTVSPNEICAEFSASSRAFLLFCRFRSVSGRNTPDAPQSLIFSFREDWQGNAANPI